MAEATAVTDPFRPRTGFVARVARRLHCTEGQLYSMAIGMLLVWTVSANALPDVIWDRSEAERGVPAAAGLPASPAATREVPGRSSDSTTSEPQLYGFGGAPAIEFDSGSRSSASSEPSSATPSEAADSDSDASTKGPVRVVDGGYASASAGTPLATLGVPEGSVAVAQRAGQTDKVTYLHLSGTGTPLVLDVDSNGTSTLDTMAALQLCIVTDGNWKVGRGDVTPADAPKYDCSAAVAGVRSAAGDSWSFDVSQLDFGDDAGVAIVPAPSASSPEFQVVFGLASSSDVGSGGSQ